MAKVRNVEFLDFRGIINSSLIGNTGKNTIFGGLAVKNTINGGEDDDYLYGGDATDSLFGGAGNDTLAVTQWVDQRNLVGSLGSSFRSGTGSDTLNGGVGNDWYAVNSQTAYIYLEVAEYDLPEGNPQRKRIDQNTIASTVDFSLKYNSNISNNIQNLYLIGGSSLRGTGSDIANTITGNDGANRIDAEAGNDFVLGGLGADVINGGTGNDTVIGGGQPQTDLPADASTPVDLGLDQSYEGRIETRQDTDWIRVSLQEGLKYYFRLIPKLPKDETGKNSDVAFGVASWNYYNNRSDLDIIGLVGDSASHGGYWWLNQNWETESGIYDHSLLVLNKDGSRAFGLVDPQNWRRPKDLVESEKENNKRFEENNIRAFSFTSFNDGEFYIPVTGAGPALGSYEVFFSTDSGLIETTASGNDTYALHPDSSLSGLQVAILADNASDTLIGGMGADSLVAIAGRDTLGNYLGDTLLGGTNGVPGSNDLDNSSDTLVGGPGSDLLDGGAGADSMIGGGGNDTYFVNDKFDIVKEEDSGGSGDLAIYSFAAARNFASDLADGHFALDSKALLAGLDSATGDGFDINMAKDYANVEFASLIGAADLYVYGNRDSNRITGNFGNNFIFTSAGSDTLLGQGGNDYLIGGDGGDYLDGGSGQNTMDGGLGDDTYIVNDRSDRVINEVPGLDGGQDITRTFFNFDPIQGTALEAFQPDQPDNSPSRNKASSFASKDITSFYNLEHFELQGQAVYGVGNALGNSLVAGESSALLLGMGREDTLLGNKGDDTLYGDTPYFYASPDLYAPAPTDTRTREFLDGIGLTLYGGDYLDGGAGDDYLDGGKGFDTMIGGEGVDTYVQDHVDDYILNTGSAGDELITSVNIDKAPDRISKLMLVVKAQDRDEGGKSITGQDQVASFASFLGTESVNDRSVFIKVGGMLVGMDEANVMELMYSANEAEVFEGANLLVGGGQPDLNNPGKSQFDLSWTAASYYEKGVVGYTVEYKSPADDIWLTYVKGASQDFKGTPANPTLTVTNFAPGVYDFRVTAHRLALPVERDGDGAGNPLAPKYVTLQGGGGNDALIGRRLSRGLPGDLSDDEYTLPLVGNNPLYNEPLGFIFNNEPYDVSATLRGEFATYIDGGYGNDILAGAFINDGSGSNYIFQGIEFKGINTLVGGQGSDTFLVQNGGVEKGDEFDWVIKYGNETHVTYSAEEDNVGSSLNGGQHNLVVSMVKNLILSDTEVHQGKFIDQLGLAYYLQFGMGNRLDNYIYDGAWSPFAGNTLVGDKGRDSIVGNSSLDVLIGGTAYGLDNVGLAIKDFAPIAQGGYGLKSSIFRDTDPVPVDPNGPAFADPSQFWFVPGYYGSVFDAARNRDTLTGNASDKAGLTLDGGAGADLMIGSKQSDTYYVSDGGFFGDAIESNGGGDTVVFTDSDTLWWSGFKEGDLLPQNSYDLPKDSGISNLILQMGSPTARIADGNTDSNLIVGNEFDNMLRGYGVAGPGIDTLVGDGLVDVDNDGQKRDEGYLSSDNFFIDNGGVGRYRDQGTWKPEIVTTDISIVNPATGVKTPFFQHDWDPAKSVYLDDDFVLIADFESVTDTIDPLTGARTRGGGNPDNVELLNPAQYSIGNLPTSYDSSKLGSIKVGPNGVAFTGGEFGIYYTDSADKWSDPDKWAQIAAPNLVAVIKSTNSLLLDRNNDGVFDVATDLTARPSFTGATTASSSAVPPPLMGWGQFYELDSSNFAQYINNYGGMSSNTANLSFLVNQIV